MRAIKQIVQKSYNSKIGLFFRKIKRSVVKLYKELYLYVSSILRLAKANWIAEPKVYYLGIPAHANLGDLAQGICIRNWLKKNYAHRVIVEIETNALVNTHLSLLSVLKKLYKPDDFIVFQSGYTTTDLGGYADEMHREVMRVLPKARMLMMPQTVFFLNETNKEHTATVYNQQTGMLFLARDRVSYQMALEMFPNIAVRLYPDIVTTLIGNRDYCYERKGILFCCRNDSEKYYSDRDIDALISKCDKLDSTEKTDTTKTGKKSVVSNAEKYIENEIDLYAHYKVIVTDRYHGTILSLVAGTPVIILKTTDHKVTTGAEWFKGVYDDYVYSAQNLDHAYELVEEVLQKKLNHKLEPCFEKAYYDKLAGMFAQIM